MASTYEALLLAQMAFVLNPPIAVVTQATVQSIPNNAFTDITMDATTVDSYGGHSNVTNPARYTAQVTGWYLASGSVSFSGNSTGARFARLAIGGTSVTGSESSSAPNGTTDVGVSTPAILIYLPAGSYVTVQGLQSSGSALNTFVGSDLRCSLSIGWRHS